ncbi:hypothetical protein AB4142_33085, partial [Variovorax sp. 2RAF20]
YQVAIIFCYLAVFYFFYLPATYGWVLIAGIIVLPVLILTGFYQWKKGSLFPLKNLKNIFWFLVVVLSSVAFILGLCIFLGQGTKPIA